MGLYDFLKTNSKKPSIDLTDYKFLSDDHTRIENGRPSNANNKGAWRGIRIKSSDNCTFYVTMYNMNGNHPIWGDNIQMAEKRMKLIDENNDRIVLRGFGTDVMGASFADYGITLHKTNGDVGKITLHMYDRKVDIVYEKAENKQQTSNEPEIVLLAKRANAQFQQANVTDGRQLLVQIYRSVKSNPGQLNEVTDFSSLGTAFLFMLDSKLSDNIDNLQMMASVGYLCISKAIEKTPQNLNLYKDRLLLLKLGHEAFSYTVMSALDLNSGGILSISFQMSGLSARDAIYKMEIADLELHPQLYQQISLFRQMKDDFDEKIARQFFMPEKTLENVVKVGLENHKKLLKYLENKVIIDEDVDF